MLVYFGAQSTEIRGKQMDERFTGRNGDVTVVYPIGGAVAGILGPGLLRFGKCR